MNKGEVGEDRGSKETNRCPLTDGSRMYADGSSWNAGGWQWIRVEGTWRGH
jgi:hypothetical protein